MQTDHSTPALEEPSPQGNSRSRPRRLSRIWRMLRGLVVPFAGLGLWFLVTELELITEFILPKPTTLLTILTGGQHVIAAERVRFADALPSALGITLQMVFSGLALGLVTGIGVGLAFGYSRWVRDTLEFTLDAIRPVPIFATIPMFILWFGIGMRPQILLVAFGVFMIMTIQTTEAVRNVPHIYVRAALTSGASRFHIYRTIVVPAIFPHLLAGLRISAAAGWGLDVAAEFMGTRAGLGYMMLARNAYLDTAGVLLIVLIFAFMAMLFDFFLRAVNKRLTRWVPRGEEGNLAADLLGAGA